MNDDLLKFCQNATERESFVGFYLDFDEQIQQTRPYIIFPYGYHYTCNDDVLCLIEILSEYYNKTKEMGLTPIFDDNHQGFPIYSYLFIIQDYLKNGYYYEKDTIYKRQNHGKINWGRTIKKEQAIIQNSGLIYLTTQAKTHQYSDEYLMTQISKYCVYESFIKMGWYYGLSAPNKPNTPFNKSIFIETLQDKLSKTNKDFEKQLFQSMINVLNTIDKYDDNAQYFTFGTRRFEKVWEYLVDKAFGTEFGGKKALYFPKAIWKLNNNTEKYTNSLFPDTININNDTIYIIDAKYYRYGITNNMQHLPNISSIAKQITYAEYINNKDFNFKEIRNIFILPFNANKSKCQNFYSMIGYAVVDWVDEKSDYGNIYTILIDTKYLMQNYRHNDLKSMDWLPNF